MNRIKTRFLAGLCALILTLSLIPAVSAAGVQPTVSNNINKEDYTTWSKPVTSYLYENETGGLTRVEYTGEQVVVEDYDSSFTIQSSRTIQPELPLWGGFFAGEDYNFLIYGQTNPDESDSVEVIRVVQYDKDWNRLGQASLKGANTTVPFDAGSLRCDEYGGYLYIRTCHKMYASSDGLNHQANLTMAVRQSDMTITDSYYKIMNTSYGYVSHSFNQFLLVDEDGLIVTLDHGDAYPRSVVFMRYYANAGTGKFSGQTYGAWCSVGNMLEFAGAVGNNTTGGSVGGLAETADCYIMAYNYDGVGGSGERYPYYHFMDKATGKSWSVQINAPGCTTPVLAPTGLDGGYMLWNAKSGYTVSDTLYYLHYAADGTLSEPQTATASLSDCQPIAYNGKIVWYTTSNSTPVFYALDESGVTAVSTVQAQPEPTPAPTPNPTSAQQPAAGLAAMLAAPTFSSSVAVKADGTLWAWGTNAYYLGVSNRPAGILTYQNTPAQAGQDYIAAGSNWGVKSDNSLWMWGWEAEITGNNADNSFVTTPVKVMDDVAYVSGDEFCTVALKTDGTLWGWGARANLTGENSSDSVLSGSPIQLLDHVKQAACTGWGWMALKDDGTLWACGISNLGNLSASLSFYDGTLTQVMDGVAAFSLAWQNTLVIKTDGSLWSWGDSTYGQVGNGGAYDSNQGMYYWNREPVKILDDVVYASAGGTAFAITSDGTLWGWGSNRFGQLGFTGGDFKSLDNAFGGIPCQSTPVRIADGVVAAAGGSTSVYLKEDGSLWAAGYNGYGAAGISTDLVSESTAAFTKILDGVKLPGGTQSAQPSPTSFVDVPSDAWYIDYVTQAAQAGLMQGTEGNRFNPAGELTLGEVATLAARLHAERTGGAIPTTDGPWYMGAYYYCVSSGIFSAAQYSSDAMGNTATRYQMVEILDQAVPDSEKQAIHTSVTVPDLAESAPYGDVVYRWYRAGILEGDETHRFNGSTNITRSETAAILCRLAGLTERI